MPESKSFWASIASREWNYIKDFAREMDGCPRSPALIQLRALWTAYCIHQDMEVDTAPYDKELASIWSVLEEKLPQFGTFDKFENYMAEQLV